MGDDAAVTVPPAELAVVRTAALAAAETAARTILDAAAEHADRALAAARAEAGAIVGRRRREAARTAATRERELVAEARAQARAAVLRAERTVVDEATAAAHGAAQALGDDPRARALWVRAEADARRRLAGAGPVRIVPARGGGLLASSGTRQIDYSLDALIARDLHAHAADLERLWR